MTLSVGMPTGVVKNRRRHGSMRQDHGLLLNLTEEMAVVQRLLDGESYDSIGRAFDVDGKTVARIGLRYDVPILRRNWFKRTRKTNS